MRAPQKDDWISMAIGFAATVGLTWFVVYGLVAVDRWTGSNLAAANGGQDALYAVLGLQSVSVAGQQALSFPAGAALVGVMVCLACGFAMVKTIRNPPPGWGANAIWGGFVVGLLMHYDRLIGVVRALLVV